MKKAICKKISIYLYIYIYMYVYIYIYMYITIKKGFGAELFFTTLYVSCKNLFGSH